MCPALPVIRANGVSGWLDSIEMASVTAIVVSCLLRTCKPRDFVGLSVVPAHFQVVEKSPVRCCRDLSILAVRKGTLLGVLHADQS